MGFLDRVGKIADGVWDAGWEVGVALPIDYAQTTWQELVQDRGDIDDLFGGLVLVTADRGLNAGRDLFGADSGVGAAIGAIPEGIGIRESGRFAKQEIVLPAMNALEWAGREGIREPLATAMTAASLAEARSGQSGAGQIFSGKWWGEFLKGDTWDEAYDIAQSRSVGQAVALAIGTRDITDEREVANFVGTDWYRGISGSIDFGMRVFADADILLGESIQGVRYARGLKGPTIKIIAPPQLGKRSSTMRRLGNITIGDTSLQTVINNAFDASPDWAKRAFTDYVNEGGIARVQRYEADRFYQRAALMERQAGDNPYLLAAADQIRQRGDDVLSGRIQTGAAMDLHEAMVQNRERYFDIGVRKNAATALFGTPSWDRFYGHLDELRKNAEPDEVAALIRDRLFPNHAQGDVVSHYLSRAQDQDSAEALMRFFMGDARQLRRLEQTDYGLAMRLQDMEINSAAIHSEWSARWRNDDTLGVGTLFDDEIRNNADRLARVNEEISWGRSDNLELARLREAYASVDIRQAHLGVSGRTRNKFKGTRIYQDSIYGRAVRTFSENVPHSVVHVEDPKSSGQIGRIMRQAGYSDTEINRARQRYMALSNEADKVQFLQESVVEAAELKILTDAGLTANELDIIREAARNERNATKEALQAGANRPRHARFDSKGRDIIAFDNGEMVQVPMLWTQVDKTVAVPDLKELAKRAKRYNKGRIPNQLGTAKDLITAGLDDVMKVWKVGALLRPGWTFKVVLLDEQLRMMAKFGVLSTLLGEQHRINNYLAALKERPGVNRLLVGQTQNRTRLRGFLYGAAIGTPVAGPIGAVVGGAFGQTVLNKLWHVERAGFDNLAINGHVIDSAFGGDLGGVYRRLASASSDYEEFVGGYESALLKDLRRNKNNWRTMVWGDVDPVVYQEQWRTIINNHFRQDPLARQLLEGNTVDDVVKWLDSTREGQEYVARMDTAWRAKHWDRVEAIAAQIDDYTYSDEVREALLALPNDAHQSAYNKILDMIPDTERVPIHGEEVLQTLGRSPINRAIQDFTSTAMSILGDMPSDELSRMPSFNRYYTAEMQRKFAAHGPGDLSKAQLDAWKKSSREFALNETRDLLYDLAERSEFSQMVRLLIPFFPAWQEVLTRWTGLAIENPVFAARGMEALGFGISPESAVERAGWFYEDDYGNTYLNLPIPEFAQNIVGMGLFSDALESQGFVRFNEDAFNLVVQGTPGFGPIAQVAATKVVEAEPELEEALSFVIPFGPVGDVEAFLPTGVKNVAVGLGLMDTRANMYARARILQTKLVEMQLGERPMIDFEDRAAVERLVGEVEDEASNFHKFRSYVQYFSPFTPTFDTPYRPYVDIYRALRSGDYERAAEGIGTVGLPDGSAVTADQATAVGLERWVAGDSLNADDAFLRLYGREFFALTGSMTKNLTGIPPTLQAWDQSQVHHDLIVNHPEWASVIVGTDAGGEAQKFSRAVYDAQFAAGDRVPISLQEQVDDYQVRLGWENYSRFMDLYDSTKVELGVTSNSDPRLDPLNAQRRALVDRLAEVYPEWYREYSTRDRSRDQRVITGAWAITENRDLAQRQDIAGLRQWLDARQFILSQLAQRPYTSITAQANRDLQLLWEEIESKIVESNPAFADLFHRKLERIEPHINQLRG